MTLAEAGPSPDRRARRRPPPRSPHRPGPRHLMAWTDAPAMAGAEQVLALLVEHLPAAVRVTVAGTEPDVVDAVVGTRPGADGVVVPPLGHRADARNAVPVHRALAAVRPDALHLNKTEVADLRYVEWLAGLSGAPRVVSVVHHVERPATAAARALTRRLAARAGAIVAVGSSLARQLAAILELQTDRVTVIPNALPAWPADQTTSAVAAPPGRAAEQRLVVGVLSRFVAHKAVDDVIAAVAAVDGVHLLIGGDGPDRGRLTDRVRRLGIEHRVELLGWVPPARVLDHCDVVASAARIEGHPLTLLDARRRGLPIVATRVGGVPDIVADGQTGLLVDPGDVTGLCAALDRLADDQPLRQAMAAMALTVAAAAPMPPDMAAAYHALYWPTIPIDGAPGEAQARSSQRSMAAGGT